jgi:hypothetical protein
MEIAPSDTALISCKISVSGSLSSARCVAKALSFLIELYCDKIEVEVVFNDAFLEESIKFFGPFVAMNLLFGSSELELLSVTQVWHCRRHLLI